MLVPKSVVLMTTGLALGAFGLALGACQTSAPPSTRPADRPADRAVPEVPSATTGARAEKWADTMQGLSSTLSDLLPLLASKAKFDDPTNFEKIATDTRDLGLLARELKNSHAPNPDPMMKIMNGLMSADVDRAAESLTNGNREYARQVLRESTSYCFQCHTQSPIDRGGTAKSLGFNLNMDVATLKPIDQAELFAATRQFDRALAAYRVALSDPQFAKADAFSWEGAARAALLILVQVKNDPAEAALFIHKLEKQSDLPVVMKKSLASWKRSTAEWAREPKPATAQSGTEEELRTAERLVMAARKRQEFPLDHAQDVTFFRAGRLVHDYLQSIKSRDVGGARALYLAGLISEATRDMNFWTLHENYYEQCIRWLPHSHQAEECFDRLKESVTLGYSGSRGVNIPPAVTTRLESFRVMADADPGTERAEKK